LPQKHQLFGGFAVSVERNLIISLLKLTKESPALIEDVKKDARLPTDLCWELLSKLQKDNLVYLNNDCVEVDSTNRLKIALKAGSLGADLQNLSDLLRWREFEEIAAIALKMNGYSVLNNVRFKHGKRRYEIDVIGCKKPLVVCVDCKRWQHAIGASALKKIVDSQTDRTRSLADSLPNINLNIECAIWEKAEFIPVVLSLFPCAYKYIYKVPVVPVLQLQDFIFQLPAYIQAVKFFPKNFDKLT